MYNNVIMDIRLFGKGVMFMHENINAFDHINLPVKEMLYIQSHMKRK